MTTLDLPERPWWKEPMVWLIAGLPATAVVASLTTYFIAAHDPDSLVKSDYRKEGFALVEKRTAADERAAGLGLLARLSQHDGHLVVTVKGLEKAGSGRLLLTIVHPTKESRDVPLPLAPSTGQTYTAALPDLGHGKRILVLEPEDRSWRITGQWQAPFSGMTEMAAKATIPSTHP